MLENHSSLPECVHELFEVQVQRSPNAVAVRLDDRTLTYQQLNERANRLAHYLRKMGVGPDVLVGISMERSLELIVAIYAILKSGGAYVPLDPAYPRERLRYMVRESKLHCLVSHSSCKAHFEEDVDVPLLLVDQLESELERESTSNLEPLASGSSLIYVIFTSGSTGNPKAAAVYHRGFTNLMSWFCDEFCLSSEDRALLVSSLSFDLTQKNLFATLLRGGTLHLYPPGPYDLSVFTRLISERSITLLNCTPSVFYPLIDPFEEKQATALSSLRVVFLGGEPISTARVRPWICNTHSKAEIANTYGPTECTDICGFYRLTKMNLDHYDFVPLGRAIHNVQMVILNSEGTPCSVGEPGELCVGGAGVGAGYINDKDLTREKFVANTLSEVTGSSIYRTGDQARLHQDGVIEFLGRLDYQVKIRGFRVELPEIERAMEVHPAVSEAIVVITTDSHGSEPKLVGCYTTVNGSGVTASEMKNQLCQQLPAHMIPSTLIEVPKFPLSPNGKVDRKCLTELVNKPSKPPAGQVQDGTVATSIVDKPLVDLESQIHALWCQLLELESVGLNDNFFDVGGDSLLLARLHQNLQSLLGYEFPITDLFTHPSIRGMSRQLGNQAPSDDKQAMIRDRAKMQREALALRRRARP